jgi:hypothetical protein
MRKYILSTIIFSFFFIFFTSFGELKERIPNELNEQKQLFNFYKTAFPYCQDNVCIAILFYCHQFNLNPNDTFSFIKCESWFDTTSMHYNFVYTDVFNEKGEVVSTTRYLVSIDMGLTMCNNVYHPLKHPFNLDDNLNEGLQYFKQCMLKSDDDFYVALVRYNSGDWNADHGLMNPTTAKYIRNVLNEKIKLIFQS